MKNVECDENDCKTCKNKCYMTQSMSYRYTKKGIVDEHDMEIIGGELYETSN